MRKKSSFWRPLSERSHAAIGDPRQARRERRDGYAAAMANFRFISSGVVTTAGVVTPTIGIGQ